MQTCPNILALPLSLIHDVFVCGASCMSQSFGSVLGRRPPVCFRIMDNILRELECLSRDELVWLSTYLAGRLRALPPASVRHHPQPEDTSTAASPAPWADHLLQSRLPIQGYIQFRPQSSTPLPEFGTTGLPSPGDSGETANAAQTAPRRLGKASKSVSIFARDPLCKDTCRYCRRRPCDVGIEHDDHTCYDCEQQLLHPEGVPGDSWRLPLLPGCESWCHRCTSQRCAVREPHDLHVCMRCENLPAAHSEGWGPLGYNT